MSNPIKSTSKTREFTLGQLHEALGKLIESGVKKRTRVCVSKESFTHPCEDDGATILSVYEVDHEWVTTGDDDGGTKFDSKGRECGSVLVVLYGNSRHD